MSQELCQTSEDWGLCNLLRQAPSLDEGIKEGFLEEGRAAWKETQTEGTRRVKVQILEKYKAVIPNGCYRCKWGRERSRMREPVTASHGCPLWESSGRISTLISGSYTSPELWSDVILGTWQSLHALCQQYRTLLACSVQYLAWDLA